MQAIEIRPEMTVLEVTERYPETIPVFVDSGFPKMQDPERRRSQGRALTLETAAQLRQLDVQHLMQRLRDATGARAQQDVTLDAAETTLLPAGDVRISGLLPCPVRIPILEAVQALAHKVDRESGLTVGWSLSAASVGADQLNQQIAAVSREEDLPEIFISAGFESFFDRTNLRRFKDAGVFVDLAPDGQNRCFGDLQLRDPDRHFTMLGVVPAVFLVNHNLLGHDPPPRTWQDLLHPRYAQRVALPVGDFDLFNGILLNLYRLFGEDAVRALSRNMLVALHPSQTVGRFAARAQTQPAISVVPYFFSKMTMKSQVIRTVWPEDGAIISPIFMLVRKSALPAERARRGASPGVRAERASQTERVARLFLSHEVGETLAHRGLFPVIDPDVDNQLPEGARFHWLGWDFIREHDLGRLIPRLDRLFREAAR